MQHRPLSSEKSNHTRTASNDALSTDFQAVPPVERGGTPTPPSTSSSTFDLSTIHAKLDSITNVLYSMPLG